MALHAVASPWGYLRATAASAVPTEQGLISGSQSHTPSSSIHPGPCPCSDPAVAGLAVAVSQGTAGHWGAGEGARMKGNWEQELGRGTVGPLPADLGGEHI